MSRLVEFNARSCSPLGRSWRLFRFIFSLLLLALICHRFFSDFGVVLGGLWEAKAVETSTFWVVLGGFFSIPYFRSIFASFLRKSTRENTWNFACFSIGCFSICLPKSLFSIMLESLKLVIFFRGNHYFYKISIFAIDVRRCWKWVKKQWVGRAKGLQKSMKFGC